MKWVCGPEQRSAFQKIKKSLAEALVLAHPDFPKPFALQTDASNVALGAVLTQPRKSELDAGNETFEVGRKPPMCYASRVSTPAE